jgi:hypothetical protein
MIVACAALHGIGAVCVAGEPMPQNAAPAAAPAGGEKDANGTDAKAAAQSPGQPRVQVAGQAGEAAGAGSEQRRTDGMRWRPDGPMPQEMIDRVIAVARDVSPDLAKQLEEKRSVAPDDMSQAMRQSARRLVALAVLKDRNPGLYAIRVEDVRLQLELRTLGEAFRAAQTAGDAAKAKALETQIAAKVKAQVDVDLRARAQELVALDEQMQAMREDLVQEQKRTAERVVERTEAVKKGEPIQERGMFGEGGGRGGRQRGDSPEGERPKGEKGDKPKTAG